MSEAPTGQADKDVPPTHTPYPHTLTFDTFVKRYVPVLKAAAEQGQRLPFPSKARFMGTLKLHGYNTTIVIFPPPTLDPLPGSFPQTHRKRQEE